MPRKLSWIFRPRRRHGNGEAEPAPRPLPGEERDETLEQEFGRWLMARDSRLLCEMLGGRLAAEFGLGRSLFFYQGNAGDTPETLFARGVEAEAVESLVLRAPLLRPPTDRPQDRLWAVPQATTTSGLAKDDRSVPGFSYVLALRAQSGGRMVGMLGETQRRRLPLQQELRLKRWLSRFELAWDNQQRIAQLEALSYTDALTGIFNRRFFMRRLAEEITRARRFGRSLSLVIFDVDNFKSFNDMYGHQAGDQLLREVAELVTATARSIDIACRYGGDEFVVVMPETSLADCFSFTHRLRRAILDRAFRPGRGQPRVRLSISLGAAVFPEHAGEPERLFWCADMAMLKAKESGRNRALMYEPGMDDASRRSGR